MSDRRSRPRPVGRPTLRVWRTVLVATTLIGSATIAYLPGLPGAASAETFTSSDATPAAQSTEAPVQSPGQDPQPTETPTADPTATPDNTPDAVPTPSATPLATEIPSPSADPSASPSLDPSSAPSPSPGAPGALTLGLTADRPAGDDGVIRVEPSGTLVLTATVVADAPIADVGLSVSIPDGWSVTDAGGGVARDHGRAMSWTLDALDAGVQVARHLAVRAPDVAATGPAPPVTFAVSAEVALTESPSPQVGPSVLALVADPISIAHITAARVPGPGIAAEYLDPDVPLLGEPRYEVFRLRFDVVNAGLTEYRWAPTLEWSKQSDAGFAPLPAGSATAGIPFFAAPEWVPVPGGGSMIGPAMSLSVATPPLVHSMGMAALPEVTIPPGWTFLVEFSVQATADADYLADYFFRLTDAGAPFVDAPSAQVTLEARPGVDLSPGQRSGVAADSSSRSPASVGPFNLGSSTTGFHAPSYDLTSDACAACHRAHAASGTLLTAQPSDLALCAGCHDGSSAPDVLSAYAGVPANDAAARSYYQHDPAALDPTYARRAECSDCHNPHDSNSAAAAPTGSGWSPSGLTYGAPAVAASYSAGGPSYALLTRPTLEYQLCLSCHSGYASLPSNSGVPLSRQILDKGVELNPGNTSYHPVSAPGTNGSAAMAASLAGSSPYKLWNFAITDTVRCVNCHADARLVGEANANGTTLTADATLSVHASPERNILIAAYRDEVLKGPLDGYVAADFALCFVCHSEAPFVDTSGEPRSDTNFRYHGLHVSGAALINHGSDGTNIDQPGDGGGLAVCAECHFRIHSSAYPINGQGSWPRLVDFAPDVSGGLTKAVWTPPTDTTAGTCTLKCHGQPHSSQY